MLRYMPAPIVSQVPFIVEGQREKKLRMHILEVSRACNIIYRV